MPGIGLGLALSLTRRRLPGLPIGPIFDPADPRLRWAPPELADPVTVAVATGYAGPTLANGGDVILTPPAAQRTGNLQFSGTPRHVRYIGGRTNRTSTGGIAERLTGMSGSFYREGAFVTMTNNGDVFACAGTVNPGPYSLFPDVIIQQCRVDGVQGNTPVHADMGQLHGSIHDFKVDRFTGIGQYQGFFLRPEAPVTGNIWLSRVNLRYFGADLNGYLMWLFNGLADYLSSSHNVFLDEVYIEPRAGETLDQCCWPNSSVPDVGGQLGSDELGIFFW